MTRRTHRLALASLASLTAVTLTACGGSSQTDDRDHDTHDRVRRDRIDTDGKLTLRVNGRLHHLGIGRTHTRTPVLLLVHDLQVRVVNAATGGLGWAGSRGRGR
jgi:hypothetical protein